MLLTWASSRGRPSLNLNFLQGIADPRITFSGGANATRVNSAGLIVAATTPRFDYDPVTLAARGLLVEESRINLILNNTAMSTQNVTTAATAYTLSFYGTGTVTLSGTSTAGPLVGSGVYPTRSTLTFTPTAGTLTLTVSGSVEYAQLETGTFATSVIINAGAALARTADLASMTGTNFSSWYNQTEGTFVVDVGDSGSSATAAPSVVATDDGTAANRIILFVNGVSGASLRAIIGGAIQYTITSGALGAGLGFQQAAAYKALDHATSTDGAAVATNALSAVPSGQTTLRIGSNVAGSAHLNGHIRTLQFYPQRLPNAQLQALSA